MKANYLWLFLGLLVLLAGCVNIAESYQEKTVFVCPDGTHAEKAVDCKIAEIKPEIREKIVERLIYVCWDETKKSNAEDCPPSPVEKKETQPKVEAESIEGITMEELIDDDRVKGNIEAELTIVMFGDILQEETKKGYYEIKKILDLYPEKVNFVFRDYVSSDKFESVLLSEAASCAGEIEGDKIYWGVLENFLERQALFPEGNLTKFKEKLVVYAVEATLRNTSAFRSCRNSRKYADEVRNDYEFGKKLSISKLPTTIIGNKKIKGYYSAEQIKKIVEEQIAD